VPLRHGACDNPCKSPAPSLRLRVLDRRQRAGRALVLPLLQPLSRHQRLLLCPDVGACCPPPTPSAIKPAHGFVGCTGKPRSGALARPWHERWSGVNRLLRFNITRSCAKCRQSPTKLAWCLHRYGLRPSRPAGSHNQRYALRPSPATATSARAHVAQLPDRRTRARAPVRRSRQALRAGWSLIPPPTQRVCLRRLAPRLLRVLPGAPRQPRYPSAPKGFPQDLRAQRARSLRRTLLDFLKKLRGELDTSPANYPPAGALIEFTRKGTR